MRQAAIHAKDKLVTSVVKGLGVCIRKVTILNEKDCIKVKQKGWLDKKDGWRLTTYSEYRALHDCQMEKTHAG